MSRENSRLDPRGRRERRILSDLLFYRKQVAGSADLFGVQSQLFPSPSPSLPAQDSLRLTPTLVVPSAAPLALRIGYELAFDLPGEETTLLFMLYAHPEVAGQLVSPERLVVEPHLPVETFADMTKSRALGFLGFRDTERTFLTLFDRLREHRVIP